MDFKWWMDSSSHPPSKHIRLGWQLYCRPNPGLHTACADYISFRTRRVRTTLLSLSHPTPTTEFSCPPPTRQPPATSLPADTSTNSPTSRIRVQEEALLAWFSAEQGVLVCTPTGTGKTLIAEAALFEALHTGTTAYYTTPLIALTEQKFREMQIGRGQMGLPPRGRGTGDRQPPRKPRRPRAGRRGRNPPQPPAAQRKRRRAWCRRPCLHVARRTHPFPPRPSISATSAPS